ncbi:AarF/UbiB family protein, partial [Mycobacterium intracellulare]|uniref:AarF/UbiB family protein n=1 Tax=Mycobacterium intracellulare TaxID=1767 RepID=UPI001F3FB10B
LTTLFRLTAGAFGAAMPDIEGASAEIADRISEEVDYRREAANITAFADLYREHPFIRVPELVPEASSDQVLTMTYLDGMD